jgi:rubrerythrin
MPFTERRAIMGTDKRFGEEYRKAAKGTLPSGICEVCGTELEMEPESGESHCPVCESPEE